MSKKRAYGVAVEPGLMRRVERQAKVQGISRSALISQLLRHSLDEPEQLAAAWQNPVLREVFGKLFGKPEILSALAGVMNQEIDKDQLALFSRSVRELVRKGGKR